MHIETRLTRGALDAAHLVDAAPGPSFATDADGFVCHWNAGAAALLGHDARLAVGRHVDELLRPRDVHGNPFRHAALPAVELALRGQTLHPYEMSIEDRRGTRITVQVGVIVVLSGSGGDPAGHRILYVLEQRHRRRRSDEVIERLMAQPEWKGPTVADGEAAGLTPRQLEVLQLLAQGMGPQDIAEELSLSVFTVRSHLRAIFDRVDARSQSEAVAKAYKLRLL